MIFSCKLEEDFPRLVFFSYFCQMKKRRDTRGYIFQAGRSLWSSKKCNHNQSCQNSKPTVLTTKYSATDGFTICRLHPECKPYLPRVFNFLATLLLTLFTNLFSDQSIHTSLGKILRLQSFFYGYRMEQTRQLFVRD